MKPLNEDPKSVENSAYDPFPEPRTIPSGWDMSEMLSTSQTDVDEEELANS